MGKAGRRKTMRRRAGPALGQPRQHARARPPRRRRDPAKRRGPAAPRPPIPSSDLVVRERLIEAATHLFNRKGYASTTVREIVEAAGVTKPVLYYYFRNKEGIYLELVQGTFARFETTIDAVRSETGSARTRIVDLCRRTYALFCEDIEIARVMYAIYYGPPQGAPFYDFDAFHLKFEEAMRVLVTDGVRTGEFREGDVDAMTFALIGALHVTFELELSHPELTPGREGLDRILGVIFEGMAATPARGRAGPGGGGGGAR